MRFRFLPSLIPALSVLAAVTAAPAPVAAQIGWDGPEPYGYGYDAYGDEGYSDYQRWGGPYGYGRNPYSMRGTYGYGIYDYNTPYNYEPGYYSRPLPPAYRRGGETTFYRPYGYATLNYGYDEDGLADDDWFYDYYDALDWD